MAGIIADAAGLRFAIIVVPLITAASGSDVAARMHGAHGQPRPEALRWLAGPGSAPRR